MIETLVLTRLARELESYPDALGFVDRFISMLTDRIAAVRDAATASCPCDRTTSLLGLRASAAMAGAMNLYATADKALTALTNGPATATYADGLHKQLTLDAAHFTTAYTSYTGQRVSG